MKNCNGYSMIHRVLIKPKCIVGFRMLKVLFKPDAVLNVSTNLETSAFNCTFANALQRQNSDLEPVLSECCTLS